MGKYWIAKSQQGPYLQLPDHCVLFDSALCPPKYYVGSSASDHSPGLALLEELTWRKGMGGDARLWLASLTTRARIASVTWGLDQEYPMQGRLTVNDAPFEAETEYRDGQLFLKEAERVE